MVSGSLLQIDDIAVLYSRKDSVWKLAEFGFVSDANSSSLRISSTGTGRGTQCYRAPELLTFDNPTYSKKTDIWSMGCILYELAVGRKAFKDDWSANEYKKSSGSTLEIHLDEHFSNQCTETIETSSDSDHGTRRRT